MKVKDIMTRDVITLSPDMSVKESMEKLFKLHISGLPVVDENKKVIGMFTEKNLIRLTLPSYVEQAGEFVFLMDIEGFDKKSSELEKIKVRDAMRKEVICVDEDTPFVEVARIMITKGVRRIPVLNKDGTLVGIVAREDIVKQIMEKCGGVDKDAC